MFNKSVSDIPINYNEFERLKKENSELKTKVKILENQRQMGAVEGDDVYKNYADLKERYEKYKTEAENKFKIYKKIVEEMKSNKMKESVNNVSENERKKGKIVDLEKKLEIASDMLLTERKQGARIIEEKNKQIESLRKEIKLMKDNERNYKVKISNLERELEREKRESTYYRNGTYTPKSTKSYKSAGSFANSYSSQFTKKTSTSYLKKNLIPNYTKNLYDKYKHKNYDPYNYLKNKKRITNTSLSKGSRSRSKKSLGSSGSRCSKGKTTTVGYVKNYVSPYKFSSKNNGYGSRYGNESKSKGKNNRRNYEKNTGKKVLSNISNNNTKSVLTNTKVSSILQNQNLYNKEVEDSKEIGRDFVNLEKANSLGTNSSDNNTNNLNMNRISDLNTANVGSVLHQNTDENIVDRLTKIQSLINQASGK